MVTKKILDEDVFLENLSKIIERDFFPHLPRLRKELGITSDATVDTPSICNTPARFDTPSTSGNISTRRTDSAIAQETASNDGKLSKAQLKTMSLNHYFNVYTSEDNASFQEIMKESEQKFKEKHPWLFKDVPLQIENNPNSNKPVMWNFKAKNALMFVPDCVELSESEKLEKKYEKKMEICYHNSWIPDYSYAEKTIPKPTFNGMKGKIGIDGNEIISTETPKIGSYNFMVTPSPAPGVDASPFMTWGEIEGTPQKVDASFTPRPETPARNFKIPDIPVRDRILRELTKKYGQAHKAKRTAALKQAEITFGGTPKSYMTKSERILSMSPAAQKLMSTKLHINVNSPFTPGRSPYINVNSPFTPGRSPYTTPNQERTPRGVSTPKLQSIPVSPLTKRTASMTDDLLKLPAKKSRASDYF